MMWTRLTIWLALGAYAASELTRSRTRSGSSFRKDQAARALWTLGAVLYLAHVLFAFAVHHDWNHAAAYDYTAQVTEDFTGTRSGAGIFINYAFTALWLWETAWWWLRATSYASRGRGYTWTVRGLFLFMIVNGAVIFVTGPMRWVGVTLVATLVWAWSVENRTVPRPSRGPV